MAPAEEDQGQTNGGSSVASTALKAAAAAAATGAATYAVKKVRSQDGGKSNGDSGSMAKSGGPGILASAAATSWEAASDALVPMAEDAAEAAGKYLAQHGPDVLRERIVPKFIEAFNDAS